MVNTLTKRTPHGFIGANVHQKLPPFSWPTLTTQLHTTDHNYATVYYVRYPEVNASYFILCQYQGYECETSDETNLKGPEFMYEIVKISDYHCSIASTWCQSTMCSTITCCDRLPCCRKKRLRNIHKQLCIVYGRATVDGSTSGHWAKNGTSSEMGKGGCHTCLPQSVLSQLSVLKFCSVFMSSFARLDV
jgi:hypothetical protein